MDRGGADVDDVGAVRRYGEPRVVLVVVMLIVTHARAFRFFSSAPGRVFGTDTATR